MCSSPRLPSSARSGAGPTQILVGIILLVEMICCVGGDDAGAGRGYHTRGHSMAASTDPKPRRDRASLPFLSLC